MKVFLSSIFILTAGLGFTQKVDTTFDEKGNIYSICTEEAGTIKKNCVFYYATGEVYRIGSVVDTNATGTWVSYYRTGTSRDSLNYKITAVDGKVVSVLDSFAFFFFGNGAIRERGLYREDKRHGAWIVYYTDGREKSRTHFNYGLREGEWTTNYRDGSLREKGQYENDMQTGSWVTYHKNGKLWGTGDYHLGGKHGLWKWRFKDGETVQAEGTFDRNDKTGPWVYRYKNGNTEKAGNFAKGWEEGHWDYYFENGELQMAGSHQMGNKVGKWKERYAPDGVHRDSSEWHHGWYNLDKKDSTWFTYYENGNPKEMWTYLKGFKTGLHKEFYPNGQLKTSHHLVGGKMFQVHGCFSPKGEELKCGTLKMGQGSVTVLDNEGNVIREDHYVDGILQELPQDH